MVTHSTWQKLHWTPCLLAPSRSPSTLSNGFLPAGVAFQAWKDPEDVL